MINEESRTIVVIIDTIILLLVNSYDQLLFSESICF
jgi:hypothetical protein